MPDFVSKINSKWVSINKNECHSSVNLQDWQVLLDVLKGREKTAWRAFDVSCTEPS